MVNRSPTKHGVRSGVLGLLLAAAVFLSPWNSGWEASWGLFADREELRWTVEGFGASAPAVFALLLVAQAVLAPLPARAVASGYVFGTLWGFVARSARLKRLDRRVEEHGAVAVFVLRPIPLVSFDAISYAAGLTGIPFWRFLPATALGPAPGTFAFVYLGAASPGSATYAALGGLAFLSVAAYAYCCRRLRRSKK